LIRCLNNADKNGSQSRRDRGDDPRLGRTRRTSVLTIGAGRWQAGRGAAAERGDRSPWPRERRCDGELRGRRASALAKRLAHRSLPCRSARQLLASLYSTIIRNGWGFQEK